jgi:hypothetical protein
MPVEAVARVGSDQRGEDGGDDEGEKKPDHFRLLLGGVRGGFPRRIRVVSRWIPGFRLTPLIYASASIYVYRDLLDRIL